MNVFLIPSWYPSYSAPTLGSFTQEQALATAELHSSINIIVSTWGHNDSFIDHSNAKAALSALKWRISAKPAIKHLLKNYVEILTPCVTWSDRLLSTSMPNLIQANKKNMEVATKRFGPIDLIHAHVTYPGGHIARTLSEAFNVPYVITEHMGPFPFRQYLRRGQPRPEITKAITASNATIAVSDSLADEMEAYGLPRPRVIPNLVDERRFSLGAPDPSRFVFFTLCLMTAQKGIDHLLQAIAHWRPPTSQVLFRIGGDGPFFTQYQALARELGIADRIQWLGALSRSEAAEQFKHCHAYVMPSRHETFGVVYAEAIACGKPVIATRCGGPESIVSEQNGVLIDVGDVSSLSQAMKVMVHNWDEYDPQTIRNQFMNQFSRQVVVKRITDVYEEVIRQRSIQG